MFYYVTYQFINGFGHQEVKGQVIPIHPFRFINESSPKGSVLLFWKQINEKEYKLFQQK